MPSIKPDQLDLHIRSNTIHTLYLFDGPDRYLKKRAAERIIDSLLTPETKDFNLNRFDGETSPAAEVISAAYNLPFLAQRRVVVVSAADGWSASERRLVAESLAGLPPSTCLLLIYESRAELRDEIPAHVISHGEIVTFWTPFEEQKPPWAMEEARQRGKVLDRQAAQLLCQACAGLEDISNELDKLALFIGKKKNITVEDIRQCGLPEEAADFKDLENAIWTRDVRLALKQGRLIFDMGGKTESTFPVFERIFRLLLLGRYYLKEKKWSLKDTQEALGFRGRTQQTLFERGLKSYTTPELIDSLGKIIKADYDIKTGALPGKIAFSLLAMNLLGKEGLSFR
ncbi:MAG: DNA polymerase III subunit delta [Elusimicrobia bacterium]|nr:DNA polymerase III subunit delta [Candidatus Obscuribacterium magneticum]